jgi:hypothetical protein
MGHFCLPLFYGVLEQGRPNAKIPFAAFSKTLKYLLYFYSNHFLNILQSPKIPNFIGN